MPGAAIFNGSISVTAARQTAAALGQYYVATNPTPGTGVLYGTSAAFSATTAGLLTISNNNPAGGRIIQLDVLSLNLTLPPTATTCLKLAAFNEVGIVAPSAGNVAVTPRPLLSGGPATGAVINAFSAASMTIPAVVGTRTLVANASLPTSLGITGDCYVFAFGGDPAVNGTAMTAVRATAPTRLVATTTPITIQPQNTCIIDLWWLTQATNGPTFEFELGYFEA